MERRQEDSVTPRASEEGEGETGREGVKGRDNERPREREATEALSAASEAVSIVPRLLIHRVAY